MCCVSAEWKKCLRAVGRRGKAWKTCSAAWCSYLCVQWMSWTLCPCWACAQCVLPQGKFSALVICQTGGEGLLLVAVIRGCIILFAYLLSWTPASAPISVIKEVSLFGISSVRTPKPFIECNLTSACAWKQSAPFFFERGETEGLKAEANCFFSHTQSSKEILTQTWPPPSSCVPLSLLSLVLLKRAGESVLLLFWTIHSLQSLSPRFCQ